ncbi:MAG: VWA domain-containing protein [Betaproteobacteria bacterium]|nr:VWA domain-containing protein [Betaproteobacteria bacterium]
MNHPTQRRSWADFFIRHLGSGRLDQEHLLPPVGVPFASVRRRLFYYARSFWDCDLRLASTGYAWSEREGRRAHWQGDVLYVPERLEDQAGLSGQQVYRAAVAHALCHDRYGATYSRQGLDGLTCRLVELLEDARIEALAVREFPGLQGFWSTLHTVTADQGGVARDYLNRLARALLDDGYRDDDDWIAQARKQFHAQNWHDHHFVVGLARELAKSFRHKRLAFYAERDGLTLTYRDDNRGCWEGGRVSAERDSVRKIKNRRFRLFGLNFKVVDESDNPSAKQFSLLAALFNFKLDIGVSVEDKATDAVGVYRYSEWDYKLQVERVSWARVLEKIPPSGEVSLIDDIITEHKPLISKMRYLLDALQPSENVRQRKLEDGADIDLNALVQAQCDIRLKIPPDPRIMMRTQRRDRDIAVLVLLDLSRSTNEVLPGQTQSVLKLTQQACVLLADAIGKVGDPFAIHGFCSDSRHNVSYYGFKHFDQLYDAQVKARLAGMKGQLSTRMGAAIRHATHHLQWQKKGRRLMILLTDGEPADVDVRDRKYLRYDTRRAVEEATREGVQVYCLTLDSRADQYVSTIFGARNYLVLDHVARLPEKLPLLYAGLTRAR